jgi:transposase
MGAGNGSHIFAGDVPVLQQIAEMTVKIKMYDRQIQQLGQTEYPETQALLKVHGVGHLTALTFVLTLGSKERFGRSRDVGCYLGLRPRRSQSGDHDPQLGITHAGKARLSGFASPTSSVT